jgi:putative nucleotidyltransferase with HDIG domain
MKRILFVDDEPNVLEGLRRMLRPMRRQWEMEFVTSGRQALEMLAHSVFDVVVTDMRMPEMDGMALLQEVRSRHPRIVRIVLSGQCDRESVFRSVNLAHQYLAKPCDAEQFQSTVCRACALQGLLADEALRALLSRVKSVPSLPALYSEIAEELKAAEPSLKKVGQIIAQDAGMTAKILQLVNSAFFGVRCAVSNPGQAVTLLGGETIKALVLSSQIFSQFERIAAKHLCLSRLWLHSQATSGLARLIARAERCTPKAAEDATTAGLLHDVGKLILAGYLPDTYWKALEIAKQERLSLCDAERQAFGSTHAEVGAYLLGLWGLPDSIVEAVAWHHRPNECPAEGFGPLTAVHAANALMHESPGSPPDQPVSGLDAGYLDRLRLGGRLPAWRELRQNLEPV